MAKSVVMVFGVVFILLGVLGFFNDPILGIFEVDAVHNVVHLVTGVLALVLASAGEPAAKTFAKIFGLVYGLMAILGLVMGTDTELFGMMEVNTAGNWLNVLFAVVLLYVGFAKSSVNSYNNSSV